MQTPEPRLQIHSEAETSASIESEQVFLFTCCIGIIESDADSYHKLGLARYCASELPEDSTALYNLNLLITRLDLPADGTLSGVQTLSIFTDNPLSRDDVSVPLYEAGCRVSYFPLTDLGITICLVHEIVRCFSEVDLFIEEQDFLYNCMEIQEEIFVRGSSVTTETRSPEAVVPEIHDDKDTSLVDHELEMMQNLISKYTRGASFKTKLAS